jgi:hypothetical protein
LGRFQQNLKDIIWKLRINNNMELNFIKVFFLMLISEEKFVIKRKLFFVNIFYIFIINSKIINIYFLFSNKLILSILLIIFLWLLVVNYLFLRWILVDLIKRLVTSMREDSSKLSFCRNDLMFVAILET